MEQPLVSVIIPTYNDGAFLSVAIQSITDQTYKNLEIIIVDDNSTDNTRMIVEDFIKKDSRITYLKNPYVDKRRIDWRGVNVNAGCFARNYGMQQAKGEWLTFQDGDDASLLNRIEEQLKLAKQYNATCVTTSCIRFEEKWLNKKLDVESFLKDNKNIIIYPETISKIANGTKGILIKKWFPYEYVPFTIKKWTPFIRNLFFGKQDSYPGAGNSPFFKKEVFKKVRYRPLSKRAWLTLSGRGADRDFLFQVAETFQTSYSFKIPLYLWRIKGGYDQPPSFETYLKK